MTESMSAAQMRSKRSRPQPRPGPLMGLQARLQSSTLDRDLASGIASWRSPAHAARALQLTTPRRRDSYADGLERVLAETERPRRTSFHGRRFAVAIPDPAVVILSAPVIWEIVAMLRGPAPVSAEGMARLRAVLGDGAGPLYCIGQADPLRAALEHIARWLPVAS